MVGRMERWDMDRTPALTDPSQLKPEDQIPLRIGVMASGNGSTEALEQTIRRGDSMQTSVCWW